ncbi:uncharacterized protein N7506_011858 [Penicillium brevicompactum]|uniref:uncharacterized protein n=1 Tax=Penicillium brevicompactum TaxID=5074 RepID=UPI002540F66A|nr:uncharacterized protein N7506_011858 [Penicillium brevicompactum]KAJ5319154.1 hypothetical protein N7506_011858 [Penicillium brevicompactum]
MKRLLSEELISESVGARCYSAGPPTNRPLSTGVLADECTLESISSPGMRAVRSSSRGSVTHVGKRRRDSFRVSREPRRSATGQQLRTSVPQYIAEGTSERKAVTNAKRTNEEPRNITTRPDFPRSISSPVAGYSNAALDSQGGSQCLMNQNEAHSMQPQCFNTIKGELTENVDVVMEDQEAGPEPGPGPEPEQETLKPTPDEMFRQLKTLPITEEQLVNEVRGIYTGLVMVEKKCIEIDKQQAESKLELSPSQWQSLVAVHRTLLYEHHDFFLASQHPSSGSILRPLADKYSMPARMWKYAIHSFLELLRQKLPGSMEYMLDFIYLSYSMMTLLLESVSHFKETWIECLGDLARYRMAVEEFDYKDRDLWAGISRYWYNQDAANIPENGRIQHHLAVLSRPDRLQQFFHYTKALTCVRPFASARESIANLVTPTLDIPPARLNLITSFVAAHGANFQQSSTAEFISRAKLFLSKLRKEVKMLGRQGQQGVYMTSCNIAAIFQFGDKNGIMEKEFIWKRPIPTAEGRMLSMQGTFGANPVTRPTYSDLSSQLVFRASSLAFHTLIVMLDQIGDQNMYPNVHISMAFVWCLTLNPAAIQRLEPLVPWARLTTYLNSLFGSDTAVSKIEAEEFPVSDDTSVKQLPEDFLMRGQAWSRLYHPENFFEGAPSEDDRPSIEQPSTLIPRIQRCLWLGVRIATFTRWMTYDQTRGFAPTQLAHEYAPIAESIDSLGSNTD